MKEIGSTKDMTLKMLADAGWVKWPLAALMTAVDYVLPSETAQKMAIGATVLIVVDTLTGFLVGWQTGTVTSAKFARVLVKLLGYGSVLTVAAVVTKFVPGMEAVGELGTTGILTLVIVSEGISVLENAVKLGLRLPFGIAEALKKRLGNVVADVPAEPGK